MISNFRFPGNQLHFLSFSLNESSLNSGMPRNFGHPETSISQSLTSCILLIFVLYRHWCSQGQEYTVTSLSTWESLPVCSVQHMFALKARSMMNAWGLVKSPPKRVTHYQNNQLLLLLLWAYITLWCVPKEGWAGTVSVQKNCWWLMEVITSITYKLNIKWRDWAYHFILPIPSAAWNSCVSSGILSFQSCSTCNRPW